MSGICYISFRAMGCQVTVQLASAEDATAMLERIPEQVEAAEDCLSRFRPHSELMQLNAHAGQWFTVSDMLFEVVSQAKQAARQTNGLYNPLVLPAMLANGYDRSFDELTETHSQEAIPALNWQSIELNGKKSAIRLPESSAIDLGGIAKAWMASKLADELATWGACSVDMGGDIAVRGAPDGFEGWPVDIEDPYTGQVLATLYLKDSNIATSGIDYRRWKSIDGDELHHIVDPRTGTSAETDVVSVTVIHPHAPSAEAYAKAVLLMGSKDGLDWLSQRWYGTGLLVCSDNTVLVTSNFNSYLQERSLS